MALIALTEYSTGWTKIASSGSIVALQIQASSVMGVVLQTAASAPATTDKTGLQLAQGTVLPLSLNADLYAALVGSGGQPGAVYVMGSLAAY